MAATTRASRTQLERTVRCPVATALDVVGDRWTLLIVRDLLRGKTRYSQLRRSVEGVTTTLLSDRLKLLEREAIIERRFYSDHPPRAEYVLTAKGHGLGVIIGALSTWGQQHAEHDLLLIDKECGHPVRVTYACEECDRPVPRSRIRIVESADHVD